MPQVTTTGKRVTTMSPVSKSAWRFIQAAVWVIGAGILFSLFFFPATGIIVFWDMLIPLAPVLVVVATGLWRNICPLATTSLLPRHFGLSKRKKLSASQQGKLNLIGVVALYAIVPIRHALFNNSGRATGILIISLAVVAVITSLFYEWKSAWCSGLCPIHPVEKLYGGNTVKALPNAHCNKCMNCVVPCPDSTPNMSPNLAKKTAWHKISGWLTIGGLPGFIWGWFQVPDATSITSYSIFLGVYKMPFIGFLASLAAYGALSAICKPSFAPRLVNIFAAAGVSCYYWFRIPALFGFGKFGTDGLLVNLHYQLPTWYVNLVTVITTLFFFYWLVIRKQNNKSWIIRPAFASKNEIFVNKKVV